MRRCRCRPEVNTRASESPGAIRGFLLTAAQSATLIFTVISIQPVSLRQPDIASCNFSSAHYIRQQGDRHDRTAEHFDVLIVGAGLSGIGAGYHLQQKCPGKSYVILEGRDCIGGTWDLFRYPGIRSDSDMYHARLFVQAVDRAEGDRRRAADFELRPRDGGRERHRQEDPLPPPRQARVVVVAGGALDGGGRAHVGRGRDRDRALHLQFPVHVLGLLQIRGRLHAGVFRHAPTSPARSCIRRNGRRISTTPASAWW